MGEYPYTNDKVSVTQDIIEGYMRTAVLVNSLSWKSGTHQAGKTAALYYPGVYDTNMVSRMKAWRKQVTASFPTEPPTILVAGHHKEAGQHHHLEVDELHKIFPQAEVYSQVHARNTIDQATWTAASAGELGLRVVRLYAPAFHLMRAFTMTLEKLIRAGLQHQVLLLPRALPMNPFEALPMVPPFEEGVYTQLQLTNGEAKGIFDYRAKGEAATEAQVEEYIAMHL